MGSEMCIRDRSITQDKPALLWEEKNVGNMTISCFQQFFIMRRKFLFALSIVNNAFGLNMAINKTSSCDDRPSISTGSQPTANPFLCSDKAMESRRRPRRYHVDRRSGRREVAPELYTLHPTLPYYSLFSKPSERDRDFNGVCFATHKRPNCVFWSDAWPAPATYHRPPREHCRSRSVSYTHLTLPTKA